jgi:hypothetical protein
MKPRLTELEDRMLAMADDEWMDLATAKAVLESWFSAPLPLTELHCLLCSLLSQEFVSCTVKLQPVNPPAFPLPEDLGLVEFKATGKGARYLSENGDGYAV